MPIISPTAISPHNRRGIDWSSYWTPQYDAVYNAMTAAGATPTNTDAMYQSKMLKQLVDEGYYDKAELLDIFATHEGGGLINWKSPGTHNPSLVGTPTFEKYSGYRGKTNNAVRLNFIPSTDSTLTSQNNVCMIVGIGSDVELNTNDFGSVGTVGGIGVVSSAYDSTLFRCNSPSVFIPGNSNGIRYFAISRNSASGFEYYINKVKRTHNTASDGVSDKELYACGFNNNGTIQYNDRLVRFVLRFTYLTETEILRLIDILEEYLAHYKTDILNFDTRIFKAYRETKTHIPLVTYDGSNQACHPSMVDCGADWNGYRYWMVNTPYISGNSAIENPSIWASADGETWVIPATVTNPVIAKPDVGYNADTDLYFENNILYMIWKEAIGANKITKMSTSNDGATWSAPVTVTTPAADEFEHTSPSLIKAGDKYYIYYFTFETTPLNNPRLRRRSCDTINGTYGDIEEVVAEINNSSHIWWHLDAVYYNNYYYLVALSSSGGSGQRCYIMKSSDGVNFEVSRYAVLDVSYLLTEIQFYYRPSFGFIEGQPYLFYAAAGASGSYPGYRTNRMKIDLL